MTAGITRTALRMIGPQRHAISGLGVLALVTLVALLTGVGCSGRGNEGRVVPRPAVASVQYPALFTAPPDGAVGIGFSRLGHFTGEPAYSQAAAMACRLLAWSTHVRVRGERLYGRAPGGGLEPGGERIELLELPEITPVKCRLDTLAIGGYGWVVARAAGIDVPVAETAASFSAPPPAWMAVTPRLPDWHYALGTAALARLNEPGSWELATYRALIELAIGVGVRAGDLEKALTGELSGASRLLFDTRMQGFQVAGRWRDGHNVYVLARVHAARAASLLDAAGEIWSGSDEP